jgi:hypothetical protein
MLRKHPLLSSLYAAVEAYMANPDKQHAPFIFFPQAGETLSSLDEQIKALQIGVTAYASYEKYCMIVDQHVAIFCQRIIGLYAHYQRAHAAHQSAQPLPAYSTIPYEPPMPSGPLLAINNALLQPGTVQPAWSAEPISTWVAPSENGAVQPAETITPIPAAMAIDPAILAPRVASPASSSDEMSYVGSATDMTVTEKAENRLLICAEKPELFRQVYGLFRPGWIRKGLIQPAAEDPASLRP